MLTALFLYSAAFFIFTLLYDYFRNNTLKEKAQLDLIKNLENSQFNLLPISKKRTYDEIKKEIRQYFGFESVRVAFGIDFSASNEWQGRKTFNGQLLHKTNSNKIFNPYQKAISQLGGIFQDVFQKPIEYSCFGFGDEKSRDYSYFPIVGSGEQFNDYQLVLEAYLEQTKDVVLSGPTNFTPMIQMLISSGIRSEKNFTILVILTDELKMSHKDNALADTIYALSNLPNICLIIVGIGDGPWHKMSYEEHLLRELVFKRKHPVKKKKSPAGIEKSHILFDNFHFVDYNSYASKSNSNENYLARAVLAKLPMQLKQSFQPDKEEKFEDAA